MRGSLFTVIIGQSGAFVNPGPIAFFCQFLLAKAPVTEGFSKPARRPRRRAGVRRQVFDGI